MNENPLFDAWRRNPAEHEEAFVRQLKKHASAVCWGMLRQVDEDIVAEAVEEVILKPDSFKGQSKFSTWFHGMVRNLVKRKLEAQRDELELGELSGGGNHSEPDGPLWGQLQERLSPEEIELVKQLWEGRTLEEIGESQGGISRQAVFQQRENMREKVREIIRREI